MIVTDTRFPDGLQGASKYKALARAIREGIVSGQFAPGERLPPVRDLAHRIGVTPGTVARAYGMLTDEGRLVAGVGRGTFVAGTLKRELPALPGMVSSTASSPDAGQEADGTLNLQSPKLPDGGQVAILRRAMEALAEGQAVDRLLRYPSRDTDLPARAAFADTLRAEDAGAFTLDDIVATHGGQNAILLVLQTVMKGAHPVVAVDDLSYGGFRTAAGLLRARLVGVEWDGEGPDPASLERAIREEGAQVYFTSSEVRNPTARSTSPARRAEVAAVVARYGVHLVDDDCYRLMGAPRGGPSYRALLPETGWTVSSPSKSISAALRVGFVVAPAGWGDVLARNGTIASFGVSPMLTDLYAAVMADADLPAALSAVRARFAGDLEVARSLLPAQRLSSSPDVPFFWIDLPAGWRAGEFVKGAAEAGVLIRSAEEFALRDGRAVHGARVSLNGSIPQARFAGAMERLRDLLEAPPDPLAV